MHVCESSRPQGEILAGSITPQFAWYLGMVELTKDSRVLLSEIAELQKAAQTKVAIPSCNPSRVANAFAWSSVATLRNVAC